MKLSQFKSLILKLFLLSLSVGCSSPDPCKNGECCGLGKVEFVRRVEGARAEYGGIVFAFQDVVSDPPNSRQASAFTCSTQEAMLSAMQLKINYRIDSTGKVSLIDSTHAYPYRVWGSLYNLIDRPGIAGPTYALYVDKVEPVY